MLLSLLLLAPLHAEEPDEEEEVIDFEPAPELDFESIQIQGELIKPQGALLLDRMAPSSISATPGGAQDVNYFDYLLRLGEVPQTDQFTAEGLLSEHDLPAEGSCHRLLCVVGQATAAHLDAQPDVTHLAQIGFTSALTELPRPPLNLVAVVDVSGSMEGAPLETVKESLYALVEQLKPTDQLTIVAFSDTASVRLSPSTSAAEMRPIIDALRSEGGTALSDGMALGFAQAAESRQTFDGLTRVVVLTDQQPNIGNTSAQGFMGQAAAAAADNIGMTLIGVSANFGAELAHQVSTVRGANLFYFSELEEMRTMFREELGAMMVPLAYDMRLTVTPHDGTTIEGLYGLPGSAVEWTGDGGLSMTVATLFPSKGGGGIFLGLSGERGALASLSLAYDPLDGAPIEQEVPLSVVSPRRAWTGLTRGAVLVDEFTSLTRISTAWHAGDSVLARTLAADLLTRIPADPVFDADRKRVETVLTLTGGVSDLSSRDPMTGLPLIPGDQRP